MASTCPFHDKRWRGETQHLINSLGRKLFQVRHIQRFRRVICICEGNQCQFPPLSKEELRQWLRTVSDEIVPQGAKKVLQNMLSTSDPALLNVVTLVRQASVGNLQRLEPPSKANVPSEPVVLEERVKLDFPAAYLGLLMGRSGTHIKALCQQHKVAVHFTGEEGEGEGKRKESHVAGPAVWVVVKHELGSGVEEFKEQLKKKAEKVVEKRKKHNICVLAHIRKRAEQRQKNAEAGATKISAGVYNTPKEASIGHFEKATSKHNKRLIPTAPYLTDGHCLQCGAPFDRQSNAGCIYHSGYLVVSKTSGKREWSCCHLETEEAHPNLEMHNTTGCCKGLHMWRPAKGVRRKHNKASMEHVSCDV